MEEHKYRVRPVNRMFIAWLFLALVIFAGIAGSVSYTAEKKSIVLQCDIVMQELFELYYHKVYHFSDIYIPIFSSDENEKSIRSYFMRRGKEIPDARERAELVELLEEMIRQDEDVAFIALFNPQAEYNYCLTANGNSLKEIWQDLPVGEAKAEDRMQLLGRYVWKSDNGMEEVFVIRGGALAGMKSGCILVAYDADIFDRVLDADAAGLPASFILTNENGVVYDSDGLWYGEDFQTQWLGENAAYHRSTDGKWYFTGVLRNEGRSFTAAYMIPWQQMAANSSSAAGPLLLVLVCFALFALALYLYSAKKIFGKVERIQSGLLILGNNRLDYRLKVSDLNDEFDEIAGNINIMAARLRDSMEKEYEMRVRQTRAELSQIQARFNPHFLYNTLEVIRGNLFRNGDLEDADYIEKLSRIFRNLTDAEPVLSIREEVTFCSLYMALLQVRYHDAVDISYDIAAELQECGILAHLIQPAIENYFVHAMSEETEYHAMEITCRPAEGGNICFTIADNGTGLSKERLEEINRQLQSPAKRGRGYGLAGIAKRIRLFYGESYGVVLEHNRPCGVRVIIRIPQMSVEEHQRRLGISEENLE